MTWYLDEGQEAELWECDLTRARLIGVALQDAVIDGLVTNLVVNGVDVIGYVEVELDRRHPVRMPIRSEGPVDLGETSRRLHAGWTATIERLGCASGATTTRHCVRQRHAAWTDRHGDRARA